MWKCKSCGQDVENTFDECPNCGTGKNWTPPADVQSFDAAEPESPPAAKSSPVNMMATTLLYTVGIGVAAIGVIAGLVTIGYAPDAPNALGVVYGDTLPLQIQRTTRMVYLTIGWAQIIGGITVGLLLYTVASIGEAVHDLWRASQDRSK